MNRYTKQRVEAQLAAVQKRIEQAEAATEETANGVTSFEIDTGEADQTVRFANVKTYQSYLDGLYSREEHLMRRLRGGTFTSVKVRRK